jgi:hypothetical protein
MLSAIVLVGLSALFGSYGILMLVAAVVSDSSVIIVVSLQYGRGSKSAGSGLHRKSTKLRQQRDSAFRLLPCFEPRPILDYQASDSVIGTMISGSAATRPKSATTSSWVVMDSSLGCSTNAA